MTRYITVDSTSLEIVNGLPSPPGSHFRLPTGQVFGFPWKPDRLYRLGDWVVGVSLHSLLGRALYAAHELNSGATAWNADVERNISFSMDLTGDGFQAGAAHTRFDRRIWQLLQTQNGYCVVLDFNASLPSRQNVLFVGNDGNIHWTINTSDGRFTGVFMSVKLINQGQIEVSHDRYMAIVDLTNGRIVSERP